MINKRGDKKSKMYIQYRKRKIVESATENKFEWSREWDVPKDQTQRLMIYKAFPIMVLKNITLWFMNVGPGRWDLNWKSSQKIAFY